MKVPMSSLITSTNVNMMIFLLYFSFCCFQQCLYMETISASPTHHLSEILLSEHYRSGNSFVQVHLIQKRWDQNSDLSPASAHSIYITPYKEQFTFLHYLKKKKKKPTWKSYTFEVCWESISWNKGKLLPL